MHSLCHASRRPAARTPTFVGLWIGAALMLACKVEAPTRTQEAKTQGVASEPAPAALREAELGPRVAFLGDSLSAGLHLSAEQAFPAILQRRFASKGRPFRLINASVSGDTSAGGLRRTDWLLRQRPAIVVLELGANDGLRGIPVETVEANLRAIVAKAQAQGAKVLLLGMRLPPSYGAEYTAEFASMYERLASDMHLPSVPFFMHGVAGVPALNLEDGLHPTVAGHELLADNVSSALERLLR